MVDLIAQGNHRPRSSFGHGKVGADIRVRALGWLSDSRNDFSRRCGRAGAGSASHVGGRGIAAINDAVDATTYIVGNIECAVRSNGQPRRTMYGTLGSFYCTRETVGEDLA